jgi:hypothetical protein
MRCFKSRLTETGLRRMQTISKKQQQGQQKQRRTEKVNKEGSRKSPLASSE